MNNRANLTQEEIDYLKGLLSQVPDMSDAAWEYACTELIGKCKLFKNKNPHDVLMAYLVGIGI
jgi:hypothetical protein